MYKNSSVPAKFDKKDDVTGLPISLLNQHVSCLAKSLYNNEKRRSADQKKFHFPTIDLNMARSKSNHQILLNEIFILCVRMEVCELKLAQLDKKITKKLNLLSTCKSTDLEKIKLDEKNEEMEQKLDELAKFKDNIKLAIDNEFKKITDK